MDTQLEKKKVIHEVVGMIGILKKKIKYIRLCCIKITSLQLWEGILTWLIYKLVLRYFLLLNKKSKYNNISS
jgi:hypothetical protein